MKISIEDKKREAVRRMRRMGIASIIVDDFLKEDNIQLFESKLGIGFWPKDDIRKVIADFEKEHDALVFTGIRNNVRFEGETEPMELVSLFYVSDHKEEWPYDDAGISDGFAVAYVYNRSFPEFSEIGDVRFRRTVAGGLARIF